MPTTPSGIPYPAAGDVPDVPFWMQQQAEFLDTSLAAGAWVNLTPINGWELTAGNPGQVMRFGPWILARGGFTNLTTPLTTGGVDVAQLPTGYRPTGYTPFFTTMSTLSASGGRGVIASSTVFMRAASGTATTCEFPAGMVWFGEP